MYNGTPMEWYTKKQATVESATYGAEFVAARVAKEQITARRLDLRYLEVPIKGASRLFGDNESVTKSGSVPQSKLNKRHQALSYHSVREAIASGMMAFHHIPGAANPADILSKHWGYQQVWPTLRPILFWKGNTADLILEDEDPIARKGSITNSVPTGLDHVVPGSSPPSDNKGPTDSHTTQCVIGTQDQDPMRSTPTSRVHSPTTTTGHMRASLHTDHDLCKPTEPTEEHVGASRSAGAERDATARPG
jgi:hypothetical protein